MQPTVENLCNQLAKHQLLEVGVIKTMRLRWRTEGGANADKVPEFRKWLVQNSSLTDFQLEMLDRGFADFLHFGEYNLIERIANGRMAGVYKALHPLGQVVAIKVLPPAKAKHPQLLGRFQREARLAVQLDHDNAVRTFQASQTKEGVYYLVMEFLEGETLEDVLKRRGPLPAREVVVFLVQALQALDHLHELGMVHRDIKPANFMLVPSKGADLEKSTLLCTVKVLDIGLGKALFDEGEEGGELTGEGTLLGTLDYMAPEQARNAASADIRADLYSLGCIAYEMLSGHPPFEDPNFMNQMRRHAEEKPRSLSEQVQGVPAGLEGVILRLLAKDPAMRPATPGQVLKELKSLSVTLGPPPAPTAPKPLKSYMTWLETQRQKDDGAVPTMPMQAVFLSETPMQPIPAVAPKPIPTPASPPAAAPRPPIPVTVPIPRPQPAPTPLPAVQFQPAPDFPQPRSGNSFKNFMATARDWAAFGIGGAFVMLIVLVYALIRLASG